MDKMENLILYKDEDLTVSIVFDKVFNTMEIKVDKRNGYNDEAKINSIVEKAKQIIIENNGELINSESKENN